MSGKISAPIQPKLKLLAFAVTVFALYSHSMAQPTLQNFEEAAKFWTEHKCVYPDKTLYMLGSGIGGSDHSALQKCAIIENKVQEGRTSEELFLSSLCQNIYLVSTAACSNVSQFSYYEKVTLDNSLDFTNLYSCDYGRVLKKGFSNTKLVTDFADSCDQYCKDDMEPLCRLMISGLCQYMHLQKPEFTCNVRESKTNADSVDSGSEPQSEIRENPTKGPNTGAGEKGVEGSQSDAPVVTPKNHPLSTEKVVLPVTKEKGTQSVVTEKAAQPTPASGTKKPTTVQPNQAKGEISESDNGDRNPLDTLSTTDLKDSNSNTAPKTSDNTESLPPKSNDIPTTNLQGKPITGLSETNTNDDPGSNSNKPHTPDSVPGELPKPSEGEKDPSLHGLTNPGLPAANTHSEEGGSPKNTESKTPVESNPQLEQPQGPSDTGAVPGKDNNGIPETGAVPGKDNNGIPETGAVPGKDNNGIPETNVDNTATVVNNENKDVNANKKTSIPPTKQPPVQTSKPDPQPNIPSTGTNDIPPVDSRDSTLLDKIVSTTSSGEEQYSNTSPRTGWVPGNNVEDNDHDGDKEYDIGIKPENPLHQEPVAPEKTDDQLGSGDFQTLEENVPGSGHFFAYFLTAVVICISGYVIFHNKQKILAFIVEGRSGEGGRRRGNGNVQYSKLKSNVEEVMPSLDKATSAKNFVY